MDEPKFKVGDRVLLVLGERDHCRGTIFAVTENGACFVRDEDSGGVFCGDPADMIFDPDGQSDNEKGDAQPNASEQYPDEWKSVFKGPKQPPQCHDALQLCLYCLMASTPAGRIADAVRQSVRDARAGVRFDTPDMAAYALKLADQLRAPTYPIE